MVLTVGAVNGDSGTGSGTVDGTAIYATMYKNYGLNDPTGTDFTACRGIVVLSDDGF